MPLLRRMLATCSERLLDQRDWALLLVAFEAAHGELFDRNLSVEVGL